MIIVKLIGGMGNQMFQYACARRLSHVLSMPLKIDISSFEDYPLWKFGLQNFRITADYASRRQIQKLTATGRFNQFLRNVGFERKSKVVSEKSISFDPEILTLSKEAYLEGYWQSEKYFKEIKEIILQDFTFLNDPDKQNQEVLNQIADCNAVSIHVRRGDYVSNAAANSVHGTCELSYYQDAVDFIAARVANPHFFVFSDDMEWVRVNLNLGFPATFVGHNSIDKGHEDLRLMSACRHNIIANSSFSWWGAWLNRYPEKIVIAPKQWFRSQHDATDLIPPEWVRL